MGDKGPVPWAPNRRKIGDLMEALADICILSSDVDQPSWLSDTVTGVIVAVNNGLLDVEQRMPASVNREVSDVCSFAGTREGFLDAASCRRAGSKNKATLALEAAAAAAGGGNKGGFGRPFSAVAT